MKDSLCIVLIVLVFSTSLNQGQKTTERRTTERRAIGLLTYPRIGRHLAMASFSRPDGSAGMVNYPRVGRSGSFSNGDRNSPRGFSSLARVDSERDFDPEISEDFDYLAGHHALDYEESRKRLEALRNGGMWLGGESSSGQGKDHHRLHRCSQQIDNPWAVLFATRDLANLDQQPVHNFLPRLAREVDHEASATINTVS